MLRWRDRSPQGMVWTATLRDKLGHIHHLATAWRNYAQLEQRVATLQHENAQLRQRLCAAPGSGTESRGAVPPYAVLAARVVNNSVVKQENYLTLDKGQCDGVTPGMGVVAAQGIVGQVKQVSDHFATVVSLLHPRLWVAAEVATSHVLGAVRWEGRHPQQAQLLHVPRHVSVQVGEEVVTAGYNAVFPPGLPIGTVQQVDSPQEAPFHQVTLSLHAPFSQLQRVYLIKKNHQQEQHDLEQQTRPTG